MTTSVLFSLAFSRFAHGEPRGLPAYEGRYGMQVKQVGTVIRYWLARVLITTDLVLLMFIS
jgi:hypothetical protein